MRIIAAWCASWLALFACGAIHADDAAPPKFTAAQLELFEKQVRPVLAEHCWSCHGAKKQEAGLRLDSRAAVLRGGDSGPIVIPGKPDDSLLVRAVRRTGDVKMPPDNPLARAAVDALTQWVQLGLPWPDSPGVPSAANQNSDAWKNHWAFKPVVRPATPDTKQNTAARGTLDRFVLARLDEAKLTLSPEADRRTLARRLSLDLIGLPPAPELVDDFLSDTGPDAYERLVDRLLGSPRYGERWARHWLDVARYADNKGYVFFEEKNYTWAYAYRDYVVESLNADLPYDQFVTQQLAADQLELGDDKRPLRALGFLTLGAHFMNNTHDIVDDRIDVVTRGLMGLTVTCGRCHDHKYDPVPQADYYSLYGVFRSCEEPLVSPLFAPPPDSDDYRKFAEELAKREAALNEFVVKKHRALVDGARSRAGEYLMAAFAARHQPATDDFMLIADTNDLNPTMILRWRVYLEKTAKQPHPVWEPWHQFAALDGGRFPQDAGPLAKRLAAAPPDPARPLNPLVRQLLEQLAAKSPQAMNDVGAAYAELLSQVDKKWQAAVAAAAAAGQPTPAGLADPAEEELRRVFYGPDAPPDVPVLIGWGFLTLLPDRASQGEYQKLLKAVETHMISGPGAPPRAHVLLDSPQPFDARVFLRGNPNRLGDSTPRQFLRVANPDRKPFTRGSGRLELAREIVRPENPLTARVLVNRLWMHHVGAPLVRTPSDFGMRSEPPTNPELLDELAARLVTSQWSIKRLARDIVTSAAFRQSAAVRRDAEKLDPENRWLWRANSRRLDFETFRDSLLVAAGSLDLKIGGPPVQLLGDGVVPRRTLYGFIDRLDVAPLLTTFDFPNPSQSNPLRDQTIVAPQALYLMNNNFVAEIAQRVVARPDLAASGDGAAGTANSPDTANSANPPSSAVDQRITRLFVALLTREPTDGERSSVRSYLGAGEKPDAEAWRRVAHALLMTNEFAFIP